MRIPVVIRQGGSSLIVLILSLATVSASEDLDGIIYNEVDFISVESSTLTAYGGQTDNSLVAYDVDVLEQTDLKSGTYSNQTIGNFSGIDDKTIYISAPNVTKYYGGSERFAAYLNDNESNPISNASIRININGVDYERTTDDTGQASVALAIPAGNYTAIVEYADIKTSSEIIIKSKVSGNDTTKIFRNETQYYAQFVDDMGNILKNTSVEFNINGVYYTRTTNENGIARMNINLNPGEYIITSTNPDSKEMHSNIVTVLPNIVENYDLTKYYRNASQYVIRLLDSKGNPAGAGESVEFNINGVLYTRYSNASGHVKMNINLDPDSYIITANYNGFMTSNLITVKSIIISDDLSMTFRDGSKFGVKLLDGQGNPFAGQTITFNINGVFYNRTTDDNGTARLNINLLAYDYIITSSFNGLNVANNIFITPNFLYFTIDNNPLDYDYYVDEYNRFSLDWFYSPQYHGLVRSIYDIYGNKGLEILDEDVKYGVKYVCYDVGMHQETSIDIFGEIISWIMDDGYGEKYILYNETNNMLDRGIWKIGTE